MIAHYLRSRWAFFKATLPEGHAGVFVAGVLALHLTAAWCNAGFLNTDEHYQIIEFAQYKLGYQSASALAWEFPARMRPALQPALAALVIRLEHALGIASPFDIAFSLRLVSMLLAIGVSVELCMRCLPSLATRRARQVALYASFLLWIVPTVHSRFSSENWGGALLVAGLCLLLDALDERSAPRARSLAAGVCAGLVWSAAFYCRFQVGIAIGGVGLWLVIVRRARAALLVALAVSFAVGCGLNEVLDHWLYGAWTLVPWNYFHVNLVQGQAATFGTSPWWMVVAYMAIVLIPPYSFAALVVLGIGSWHARRHVLVAMAVPFLLVHAVLAHKEARFLIPLLYVIGPWFAVCIEELPHRLRTWLDTYWRTSWGHAAIAAFGVVNVVALSIAIVMPANDRARLDRWLWDHSGSTVYPIDSLSTGLPAAVTNSFYGSQAVIMPVTTFAHVPAPSADAPVFIYYKGVETPDELVGCTPVLRTFPVWFETIDVLRRLTNVHIATVCRLEARASAAYALSSRPTRDR